MARQRSVWLMCVIPLIVWGCTGEPGDKTSPTQAPSPSPSPSATAPIASVSVSFDSSLGGAFYDFPWPSDLRLTPAGTPDLSGFPQHPGASLLGLYVEALESDVVGFGTNSPAYFRFTGPINVDALPRTQAEGAAADLPLLLVNIDPASPHRGERVPVRAHVFIEATDYNPPNLLALAPVWGFPLRGATRYGAVVLTALGDAYGRPLEVAPELAQLTAAGVDGAGDSAVEALYAPLWEVLESQGISLEEVAAATVFTTQDPVSEMGRLRAYIAEAEAPVIDDLWYVPEGGDAPMSVGAEEAYYQARYVDDPWESTAGPRPYHLFEGRYQSPNFQSGEPPFTEEGGGIEFDESGEPIVQYVEDLRFALTVPKGPAPAQGWPLVLYAHGTGGDYKSFMFRTGFPPAITLTERGIAVMSIDEPLHGPRGPDGTDEELASFNFFNPDASRSNFRQAAIDVFQEVRVAREALHIPAHISPTGQAITFNPERLAFMGHSHGGLSGALLFPFEGDITGAMLSGAGGGLSLTILNRKDYVDFEALFRTLLYMEEGDDLNSFHTAMALVQTLVDVTDPINYSPHFFADPMPGLVPRSYMQSQGFFDAATPPITIEAMAVAARLPILEPLGRSIDGLRLAGVETVSSPVSGNIQLGRDDITAALVQFPYEGHSAIFRDADGAALAADFLLSLAEGEVGTLQWGDVQP